MNRTLGINDSRVAGWMRPGCDRTRLICLGLFVITLIVYLPAIGCDFIDYDDGEYVFRNEQVQHGLSLSGVGWAFETGRAGNWHPLTWLSHMLDCQWCGLKPWGHHLTNVLFHCANAVLLFCVLKRLTGALWRSAMVVALFAWHPLHVESVAWVAERKDVLSTFFILWALWHYANYFRDSSKSSLAGASGGYFRSVWYWLALFLYSLSLMSKPMFVTFPFVLLLLDYWPLRRFDFSTANSTQTAITKRRGIAELLVEKLPFFALALTSSVITYRVQSAVGAISSLEALPLGLRLSNLPIAYVRYIGKTFWPESFEIFYPFPPRWPAWQILTSLALLVGISFLALRSCKTRPYVAVGWFFFLGTLVPVIGLLQAGTQALADRYTYMPVTGLFVAITWLASDFPLGQPFANKLLPAAAVLILAGCVLATRCQLSAWKDTETLYTHAVRIDADNYFVRINLASLLESRGRDGEALTNYCEALRVRPGSPKVLNNVGVILLRSGKADDATGQFREAIKIDPNYAEAHNNLGNALVLRGNPDEALSHYAIALSIKPSYAEAYNNRGKLLESQSRLPESAANYSAAIMADASYQQPRYNLARMLLQTKNPDDALADFAAALRKSPEDARVLRDIAYVAASLGRTNETIKYLVGAIRNTPEDPDLYNNLGNAYVLNGKIDLAEKQYTKALRLKPDFAEAHYNLGNILSMLGRSDEAIQNYREAVRLKINYADAHYQLGARLSEIHDTDGAIAQWRLALHLQPDNVDVLNNIARTLATAQNPKLRDPPEAVRLAERACKLSRSNDAWVLDTLAAAYARAGRFDAAITASQKSIALAQATKQANQVAEFQKHLELYRSHRVLQE